MNKQRQHCLKEQQQYLLKKQRQRILKNNDNVKWTSNGKSNGNSIEKEYAIDIQEVTSTYTCIEKSKDNVFRTSNGDLYGSV